MKLTLSLLTGGLIAFGLPAHAQETPAPAPINAKARFGPETKWNDITEVQITNLQDQPLGRILDLTLDLSNARVVEVLVVSGQTLGFGGKTVAVPPQALITDMQNKTYRIDMSVEKFKAAPAFDLRKWDQSTQPNTVAAAYRYFGQEPYYLAPGEADRTTAAGREVRSMGIVERMTKLINIKVENLKGTRLGRLQSLVLDVPNGVILNTYVQASKEDNTDADTFREFSTIIPPTLLSFNAKRDGLLLDISKVTYSQEPHVIFENGADGQRMATRERPATGPLVSGQGTSDSDLGITAQINKSIKDGNFDAGKVEVTTLNGRVTLRGSVNSQTTKDGIGAIAIAAVKLANVDNQIEVMSKSQPSQASL